MADSVNEQALQSVRAEIAKVETYGQSYTSDGRTQVRSPLSTLYERERELEAKVNAEKQLYAGRTYARQGGRGE
jgi:hypothetical protein